MSVPRFLLDEHVWGGLVDVGQEIGADVLLVQTRLPVGADDEAVLAFAASQERILLTSNAQDFAPLVAEWFLVEREHWGVIIVPGQTNRRLLSRALKNIVNITVLSLSKAHTASFKSLVENLCLKSPDGLNLEDWARLFDIFGSAGTRPHIGNSCPKDPRLSKLLTWIWPAWMASALALPEVQALRAR